jgi:hypothetical protein
MEAKMTGAEVEVKYNGEDRTVSCKTFTVCVIIAAGGAIIPTSVHNRTQEIATASNALTGGNVGKTRCSCGWELVVQCVEFVPEPS